MFKSLGWFMVITIEFWHVVGYLLSFLGFCFGFGKLLLVQYSHKLDEKFKVSDERRRASDERLTKLILSQEKESEKLIDLERQFMQHKAEMPLNYVRRDDYVRGQTVIEAKLDALASKFETLCIGQKK